MSDGPAGAARRRLPIAGYALVFPAAMVVHIWVGTGIHPASMIRPLIVTLLVTIILAAVSTAASRTKQFLGIGWKESIRGCGAASRTIRRFC